MVNLFLVILEIVRTFVRRNLLQYVDSKGFQLREDGRDASKSDNLNSTISSIQSIPVILGSLPRGLEVGPHLN
jgi:hypothetical protein